jgi:hypothetical protein
MQKSYGATNPGACQARLRRLAVVALLCVLLGALVLWRPIAVSYASYVSPQKSRSLICVVSGEGDSEMTIDAVVIVENGKLEQPYADDNENDQTRFAKEYFNAGRKYRLTFGGGDAGIAKIIKWDKGCNNIHATAEVSTSVKLKGRLRALATDSETLGSRSSARRAPTEPERAAVMQQVRQLYRQKGATPAMLQRLTTTNLTATDLNGDGNYELVGSFVIATQKTFRRDLFMIAEPQGAGYKMALVDYQSYKLPAEGYPSAIDFVDQLDLDGDGIGEVFAIQGGFDGYGYAIYKKQNGRWRNVYSVTGDAC